MQAYIARRLLALVPTLLFVSLIVFVSMRLIPGDVIDLMLAQNDIATGQDRARIEATLGLDQPVFIQYHGTRPAGHFEWLGNVVRGDFGRSLWNNVPVSEQLLASMPITFELGFLALIVALTVARLHRPPPARARTDAAVRQPHRVRVDAPHPRRRHRPHVGAERHRDRPGPGAHAHRRVLGRPARHGRRLHRPLVLPGHAGGARVLARHAGHGVPLGVVAVGAGGGGGRRNWSSRRSWRIRSGT